MWRLRLVLALTAAVASVQERIPADVASLLDLVSATPPEFAADAILKVQSRVKAASVRAQLLEDAFLLADSAQETTRRKYTGERFPITRIFVKSTAYGFGLDRLSLRRRAVEAMLPLDPKRARQMLVSVRPLGLHEATCAGLLIDDVSAYYAIAARVINEAFEEEERRKGEHLALAIEILQGIASPVELGPAALMILQLRLSAPERDDVVSGFASALARVNGDDLSFSESLWQLDGAIRKGFLPLLSVYRGYLVRHLTGVRCASNVNPESSQFKLEAEIAGFLRDHEMPLSDAERRPAKTEMVEKPETFGWDQARLVEALKKLIGSPGKRLSDEERNTVEWRSRFSEVVRLVDVAKPPAGQDEFDFFKERSSILSELAALSPPGPERQHVLGIAVHTLAGSPVQRESWIEWFVDVAGLMDLTLQFNPSERDRVLTALANSSHPVLVLYARLERLD